MSTHLFQPNSNVRDSLWQDSFGPQLPVQHRDTIESNIYMIELMLEELLQT
jgi:hypothetical protein